MADKKSHKDPKDPKDPNPYPDDTGEGRPKHDPHGREHQVHKEILERRMRGGPTPDPEAYTRALEEWKNLPGSIIRPPTDVTTPPAKPSDPADPGSKPDKDEPKDKERQS